ncbi:MAG: ZIP family metal transporter [Candidatus Micrarchaeota archaeon]
MDILMIIILATFAVSLLSLVGILFLGLKKDVFDGILSLLVSFAIGAMLGGAFFHMIPESFEENRDNPMIVSLLILIGFMAFFIVEKFLHWRHCHEQKHECKVHPVAYLNLIGDGVHNLTDGAVIAVSFLTNIEIGIASTIAILLHEIPQEIGDFAVLIKSGLSREKAIYYNLLTALTAVIGGLIAYFSISIVPMLALYLLPIAAGGFIYIAAVDLIPELHKEQKLNVSIPQFVCVIAGLGLMYCTKILLGA